MKCDVRVHTAAVVAVTTAINLTILSLVNTRPPTACVSAAASRGRDLSLKFWSTKDAGQKPFEFGTWQAVSMPVDVLKC